MLSIGKKTNYTYSEIIFYQSRLKQITITNQFLDYNLLIDTGQIKHTFHMSITK